MDENDRIRLENERMGAAMVMERPSDTRSFRAAIA
jgi:hypothetical protein